MPLVRVDLPRGKSADYKQAIGDVIYAAMRATINVPEGDRFQIFAEHAPEDLSIDPNYLGISRARTKRSSSRSRSTRAAPPTRSAPSTRPSRTGFMTGSACGAKMSSSIS